MPIREGFVNEGAIIGENLDTGYNVTLRKGAVIGDNVCIWTGSVVDPDAVIGNSVKLHVMVYVSQGTIIEDGVFVGPGVRLLNDKYPPRYDPADWEPPTLKEGAVIGGGAVICPGVTIGKRAIIGAGSVVLRDVPDGQIWAGVPARRIS